MATAPVQRQFLYRAMTMTGRPRLGLRHAKDQTTLADDLRRRDLLLLHAWTLPIGGGADAKVPLKDEAALNEQIHVLQGRGVPLVETLEVASTVVSSNSRMRIERLRELVGAGSSFAQACEQVGGFDDVTIAVYRSAERTGDLSGAAHRLAQAARRRLSIAGKAGTVLIYPSIVLSIAVVLISILLVVVVPMLASQFAAMNAELPWYSQIVFNLGVGLRENGRLVLLLIAAILVAILVGWRWVVRTLAMIGRKLPAIRALLLATEMTRFFSVMAAMTKSGVTLAEALGTATGTISDPRLREQLAHLRKRLIEGGILRQLIEQVDALPLATRRLMIAAERGGDLDSAFDALAQDAAEEVERRSSRLLALLEPAAILVTFGLLAPIIISIAAATFAARPF
ncbi:MAG: hypothetical protein EA380_01215 [Phycisphaeraceae bacterium]|nr:MAG: hypothetical protein EA380_01215 [Phycisphaeraceae bacterium]